MNDILITDEILKQNGFKRIDTEYERSNMKAIFFIDDYTCWNYNTVKEDGNNYLSISFQKGLTNNNAIWNVHIDNNYYETIGSAHISSANQFNMLMDIFDSKFRL